MSDVSQGPGWWIASDGKWYPPELHPDYRAAVEGAGTQTTETTTSFTSAGETHGADAVPAQTPAAQTQAAQTQWAETPVAETPVGAASMDEARSARTDESEAGQKQAALARLPAGAGDPAESVGATAGRGHVFEEKSFFASLFDFSFGSFVTMRVIRVLYALIVLLYTLGAVGTIVGLVASPDAFRVVLAVVAVPIAYVVSLTFARISLEILMVVFDIGKDVRALRERADAPTITLVAPDTGR